MDCGNKYRKCSIIIILQYYDNSIVISDQGVYSYYFAVHLQINNGPGIHYNMFT